MVVTLHRLFEHLFRGHHGEPRPVAPQPQPEPSVRPGIPDGYLDKLPPLEEREAAHPNDPESPTDTNREDARSSSPLTFGGDTCRSPTRPG